MSRQELRAPDVFQRAGVGAESWIAQRKTLVLGAVIAGLGVFFVVMLTPRLSDRREEKARTAQGTAVGVLSRPVQADLPPGSTDDPRRFKSEQERDLRVWLRLVNEDSALNPRKKSKRRPTCLALRFMFRISDFSSSPKLNHSIRS
jgi:hypothetical protein